MFLIKFIQYRCNVIVTGERTLSFLMNADFTLFGASVGAVMVMYVPACITTWISK